MSAGKPVALEPLARLIPGRSNVLPASCRQFWNGAFDASTLCDVSSGLPAFSLPARCRQHVLRDCLLQAVVFLRSVNGDDHLILGTGNIQSGSCGRPNDGRAQARAFFQQIFIARDGPTQDDIGVCPTHAQYRRRFIDHHREVAMAHVAADIGGGAINDRDADRERRPGSGQTHHSGIGITIVEEDRWRVIDNGAALARILVHFDGRTALAGFDFQGEVIDIRIILDEHVEGAFLADYWQQISVTPVGVRQMRQVEFEFQGGSGCPLRALEQARDGVVISKAPGPLFRYGAFHSVG